MSVSFAQEKILLIGPDGQVGHAVAEMLTTKGIAFVVAGLTVETKAPDSYQINLTDLTKLEKLVREIKPTIIINPAAYTAVDKAESEQELALTINAKAPEVLARCAKDLGAFLIHYSTDYVFDGSGNTPRDESATPNPVNYYGHSKKQGELALEKSGCTFIVLRTSWVFSETGHNFVKTMLKLGQERDELRIVSDQVGAPTSAAELARATFAVMEKVVGSTDRGRAVTGIYHCCCAGETNWQQFATTIFDIARQLGFSLKVKTVAAIATQDYPTPAKRPLNSRLDCGKFSATFNHKLADWKSEVGLSLQALAAI